MRRIPNLRRPPIDYPTLHAANEAFRRYALLVTCAVCLGYSLYATW